MVYGQKKPVLIFLHTEEENITKHKSYGLSRANPITHKKTRVGQAYTSSLAPSFARKSAPLLEGWKRVVKLISSLLNELSLVKPRFIIFLV